MWQEWLAGALVVDEATGEPLGRVKTVQHVDGEVAISVERGDPPLLEPIVDVAPNEPDPEQDYMIGQIAAATVLEADGQAIVLAGQRITPDVLKRARRAGLLHRLEAAFE